MGGDSVIIGWRGRRDKLPKSDSSITGSREDCIWIGESDGANLKLEIMVSMLQWGAFRGDRGGQRRKPE